MSNKKLFSFSKQNNAAKVVNHFIILAIEEIEKIFTNVIERKASFQNIK